MLFSKSKQQTELKDEWIPYRENGEVKYMRKDDIEGCNPAGGEFVHTKPSGWGNLPSTFLASAPQLLQERYTDDSIIPVIVTNVVTIASTTRPRKQSLVNKIFKGDNDSLRNTKAVWMPRRDYVKWFARDKDGNYIGTESERAWTEEELDEAFRRYAKCT